MADWIFDGLNKIIKEPGSGPGNTTVDIARDIYSAWKRWVQTSGAQFDSAFTVEGGTPIGATGLFTGTTFLLVNGWKLMGGDWDHQTILNGNIYSDDGVVSVPNPSFNTTVFINASTQAQGISTSGVQQSTLDLIRKLLENRVTRNQDIFTVFDDDGSTPLRVFDLSDRQRIPQ